MSLDDLEAGLGQAAADLVDLGEIPGLHAHPEEAAGDGHVGVGPLVADRNHIGAAAGDDIADAHQLAGLVLQGNQEVGIAARGHQAPGDDPGEDVHIDIAAGDQADHLLADDGQLVEHGGGHADRARALGDELLLLNGGQDGRGNLVLGDRDDVVHVLLHQGEGGVAGVLDGDAVGKGMDRIQGDLMALAMALEHAGGVEGLDAVDLYRGLELLDGEGHAGNQAAAADGHDDRVHIPHLLENLQADGALTGDDLVVVKGVDKGRAGLLLGLDRGGVGVVVGAVHQDHLGPQALGGLHFADGRRIGHIDHAPRPLPGGGQRHALGMVAGAAGDDARLLLLLSQLADLIVRAPELEAAGDLEVLGLQVQLHVLHQVGRVDQIRAPGHLFQHKGSMVDFIQGNHWSGDSFPAK